MNRISNINKTVAGFTLVELIISTVVIGILATITYSGVGVVIIDSKETEMKANLTGSRQKIEEYKRKQGVYPQFNQLPAGTIPASYEGNYIYASNFSWTTAGAHYCLEVTNLVGLVPNRRSINYHISSVNTDPLPGNCNGFQQEALGNGLGGQTIEANSQYGSIEVEGKTPLKGKFKLTSATLPPGYVSTALVRTAIYLNGTLASQQTHSQYSSYVCTGCSGSFSLGTINYGTATAVVKSEWQHPTNGWSELISATLP